MTTATLGPTASYRRRESAPLHMTGLALLAVAAALVLSTAVEFGYGDPEVGGLALSAGIVAAVGGLLVAATTVPARVRRIDAFTAAVAVWFGISLAGAVPYVVTHALPSFELALFESVSGFTAAGGTVLASIEDNGHGLLLFRQLTQWLGSIGMVVLAVAVLTFLGVGGMQLLAAEAPGPEVDRLAPRVSETAKRLWLVYLTITAGGVLALLVVGMGPYDAVAHSLTAIATGGFSPKNASVAFFDSVAIELVLTALMFLGGVNFALMYRAAQRRDHRVVTASSEFRTYVAIVVGATATIAALLVALDHQGVARATRDALFNVVSLVSTCGFGTADFTLWTPATQLVLLGLMVTGAMAGSTSGAVKLFRVQVVVKHAFREVRRIRRPRGVFRIRLGDASIDELVVAGVLGFFLLYVATAVVGVVALCLFGADLPTSAGSIITALGGVGPGLGATGPASNFLAFNAPQRLVMDLCMLLGRLEIFPVLAAVSLLGRRRRPSAR